MADRPRFFDDLAGVAGGAMSALVGLRDEAEAIVRARVDEAVRALNLVRRDELEAVEQMAALARAGQEAAEQRLADLEQRMTALEARLHAHEAPKPPPGGGGPGMIA
jgi:BMFP domain-containing protein YqiC